MTKCKCWRTTGPTSSFMLFPDHPDPAGNQANEGTQRVLLVASLLRNQHWSCLGCSLQPSGPFPWDETSFHKQTIRFGTPSPKLWALHLWPLDGSLRTFPRVCKILFLRLEHRLRDSSMPLSGLSSPPGVVPAAQTQFYVTYCWYCPSCKSCWKWVGPLPCSRSM